MAAVMRVRIGCITKKLVQLSLTNPVLRDKNVARFHRSAFLGVAGQGVKMPSLSPTMSEGTIVKWVKKEGDRVAPGDIICEIQTDKAVVGFEVEEEGILAKILVPENTPDVKVGTLIALMVNEGEDWKQVEFKASDTPTPPSPPQSGPSLPPPGAPSGASSKPSSDSGSESKQIPGATFKTATMMSYGPAVRYLLERYELKANVVTPSGHRSKLLKEDVLKHIKDHSLTEKPIKSVPAPAKKSPPSSSLDKTKLQTMKSPVSHATSDYKVIELSNIRKTIARRLTESKTQIPHSYGTIRCDISKIIEHRTKLKAEGMLISVNDFIVKAVGCALQQFPEVNAHWIRDKLVPISSIDISVAVATEAGLITPIVFDVPRKGMLEISSTVKDLAKRARLGKLKPQEFMGGSFTITNLGMFGIKEFSAIINPPQCAILAIGGGLPALNKDLTSTTMMCVTLSYDRRAFDETVAAEFLRAVQIILQDPSMMVVGASPNLRVKIEG